MNLKYLTEKRAENQEEMQKILNAAKLEKRVLTEDKITKFNELKKLITGIDATINAEEEAREMNIEEKKKENSEIEEKTEKKLKRELSLTLSSLVKKWLQVPECPMVATAQLFRQPLRKKSLKKLRNFPLFTKKLRSLVLKVR